VLGGLDLLVFAAGIGENSSEVRQRICGGLEFLGIALDEQRNARKNATTISSDASKVRVMIVPTDEESMLARSCTRTAAGATLTTIADQQPAPLVSKY
jgi:acetate kinase